MPGCWHEETILAGHVKDSECYKNIQPVLTKENRVAELSLQDQAFAATLKAI